MAEAGGVLHVQKRDGQVGRVKRTTKYTIFSGIEISSFVRNFAKPQPKLRKE